MEDKERQLDFILKVLSVFSISVLDATDQLWWRTDDSRPHGRDYSPITFFVNCSDFFAWGTSDLEELNPENFSVLTQAIADVRAVAPDALEEAPYLFCARQRNSRPQGAAYKHIDRRTWHLFDAAGPERVVDLLNPHDRPALPNVS